MSAHAVGRVRGRHRPAAGQHAAEVVAGDLRRVGVDVRRARPGSSGRSSRRASCATAGRRPACDGHARVLVGQRRGCLGGLLPGCAEGRRGERGDERDGDGASSAAPRGRRADDPDRGMLTPPSGTENANRRPTPAVRSLGTGARRCERVAARCSLPYPRAVAGETRRHRGLTRLRKRSAPRVLAGADARNEPAPDDRPAAGTGPASRCVGVQARSRPPGRGRWGRADLRLAGPCSRFMIWTDRAPGTGTCSAASWRIPIRATGVSAVPAK